MDSDIGHKIAEEAEDVRIVDKKKEVLGCLGVIGEETLGCVLELAFVIGIGFIISLIAQTCS